MKTVLVIELQNLDEQMEYSIFDITKRVRESGVIPIPANAKDIDSIKKISEKKLPESYIQFLEQMGSGTQNGFLVGHSCFVNELPYLKKWARELLNENNFESILTDNDFVFWMSQGYQFAFFKLDEGENPPVYYYREGTNQSDFVKITENFTEFLHRMETRDKYLFHIEKAL